MKMTLYLLGCTLVAALGGLLFGFDTAVISGTTDWLRKEFGLSEFTLGFTVASALIGTIIGSIAVGRPADAIGRRGILFVIAVFFCRVGDRLRAARGTGGRSWPSVFSAGSRWAGPRWCRRCISPKSRRPATGDGSWPSHNSTSCSASCWPTSRTTSSAACIWERASAAGCSV